MKKFLFFIVGLMLLMLPVLSQAEEGKLEIQLEPMYMDVSGADIHVGDVFKKKIDWYYNYKTGFYTAQYGVSYNPINLNMDSKFTLRGEINYRKGQWGVGLSGWWFNPDASKQGVVYGQDSWYVNNWPVDAYGSQYENGVRMWDHTISPVYNELPGDQSPVWYWADTDLNVWTLDLYGIRTLAEKKDSVLDVTFGLKLGQLDNERNEGQRQWSYFDWNLGDWDGDRISDYYIYDNHITLASTSKADYNPMAGPVIGLQAKMKAKRLGIESMLNQAILIGNVELSGNWKDIDDIVETLNFSSARDISWKTYYEGNFPFHKSETVAIPVTEARLKFTYDLYQNKKINLSLGIGGFASIWYNAPLAPSFSIPGDWNWQEGTGWKFKESTLIFYGATAGLRVAF